MFLHQQILLLSSGKLKHANFNFGFGQKQNYTKTNTKSSHDCYSVSPSYLLRQLYRKIFIMTSTACLVLSTFFTCYCTETSLCNRPRGIRLFTMFLCNWYLKRWTDNVMLLIFSRELLHTTKMGSQLTGPLSSCWNSTALTPGLSLVYKISFPCLYFYIATWSLIW